MLIKPYRNLLWLCPEVSDVVLNDGKEEKRISLNRSYMGLYVPKMIWRQMENFSTNSLVLIVADQEYRESEYIRDFTEFQNFENL